MLILDMSDTAVQTRTFKAREYKKAKDATNSDNADAERSSSQGPLRAIFS